MATVFIKKAAPKTVVDDYQNLLRQFRKQLPSGEAIIIKLNLSWTKFYPACSSPPWQLEGIIKGLLSLGFSPKQIIPVENKTVVTNVKRGAVNHAWNKVCQKYGVQIHFLDDEPYRLYQPKGKMLILDKIFPAGISLPKIVFNKPLISLCTLKTHVFTQNTGAIKNYFGMLDTNRHHAHRFIHQAIIDLLTIQKEIHPQTVAFMDGTTIGYGSGPRAMKLKKADLILASTDQVALDSTAAKIIGLNNSKINYLCLGEKLNLGENRSKNIRFRFFGQINQLPNFRLKGADNAASCGQKFIYHHCPWWLEKLLLQTIVAPWSYLASRLYYDFYWYQTIGRKRLKAFLASDWGKLFQEYQQESLGKTQKSIGQST
ncbi:MAG: DUF362 domain-containing protein [Candidatus Shapirobacteria bacterium]|nr:DUF362 domain-containing protein [Candidatus Shapirobacteria bacterium]MDD5073629.1 DUF362 domain-containing protein [Candidatus Shapirobacteria bacterium]MDD5481410.1 DUF362 domain-containing protein [Candidatus Shapirobacteria bacterium]